MAHFVLSYRRTGTGAERMAMTRVTGFLLGNAGYEPRHRSPRRDEPDAGWLTKWPAEDPSPDLAGLPAGQGSSIDIPWPTSDAAGPDLLDQLANGQLRRILEGCAINDLAKITPELVQVIAHSSHTSATLTSAWQDFQQATQDAYALHLGTRIWWEFFDRQDLGPCPEIHAVEIKLSRADDAWSLITNGCT